MQIWPDRRKRGIIPQGDRTGDYEFDIGGVSPLYVLNEMAAIDRHRRLNITVPYVGFVTVTWWFADDPTSESSVLVEGNPLDLSAQLHFIAADRNREVEVHCRGLMEVSVQERPSLGGSLPIVLVLKKLIRFVQIYVFGLLGHCVER